MWRPKAPSTPYRAPTISNYRMTIVQGSVQAPGPDGRAAHHTATGIFARRS
jgi:hypothetical protein